MNKYFNVTTTSTANTTNITLNTTTRTANLAPEPQYHFGDIVRRTKTGEEYMVLCDGELTGLGRSFVCLSRTGLRYEWWTSEIEKVA